MAMAYRVHDSMAKEVASDKPMIMMKRQRDSSSPPYRAQISEISDPCGQCCRSTRIIADGCTALFRKERCEMWEKNHEEIEVRHLR